MISSGRDSPEKNFLRGKKNAVQEVSFVELKKEVTEVYPSRCIHDIITILTKQEA